MSSLPLSALPALNAALNATCAVLLVSGYLMIRRGQGWMRPVYFSLLTSHTILAAGIVPLVLVTLSRALRGRFDRHVRIARWTLPLWLYVSVTGVIVYWMLYHLYGRA